MMSNTGVAMKLLLALAALIATADAATMGAKMQLHQNPIRRVVSLLQMMQAKINEEGKEAQKNFDEFMCYCKKNEGSVGTSIGDGQEKVPQLESEITSQTQAKAQNKAQLEDSEKSREEAKEAIAAATALREEQEAEFKKESASLASDIAALTKAIAAIEGGLQTSTTTASASFLQTGTVSLLRRLSNTVDMNMGDREMLDSFLSGDQATPGSSEIVGILKQIKEEMEHSLADLKAEETERTASYEALVAAKKKEIEALRKVIESKITRQGELGVKIAEDGHDLEDNKEALAQNQEFLANIEKTCQHTQDAFNKFKSAQGEEITAIADTIKVLNDDDALDLFKKTLPSASSFLQMQVGTKALRSQALQEIRSSHRRHGSRRDPRIGFIELALRGKTKGFESIIKTIDTLVEELHQEQKDDDERKAYCEKELEDNDDLAKERKLDNSDIEKAIASIEEDITKKKSEIEALEESVKKLDEQVAEATAARKQEHADQVKLLAENTAAQELLEFAKNRLNKYYNPELYVAKKRTFADDGERIYAQSGGEVTTPAPGGIANTGIMAFVQVHAARSDADDSAEDFQPSPEDFQKKAEEAQTEYKKQREGTASAIEMLHLLTKDLAEESAESTTAEKEAQKDYEAFMEEAKKKRAADSQTISDDEGSLADMEELLIKNNEALKKGKRELAELVQLIASLHGECDWLLQHYKMRKEARTGEIEALGKGKAVLSGADYTFVQLSMARLRGNHAKSA